MKCHATKAFYDRHWSKAPRIEVLGFRCYWRCIVRIFCEAEILSLAAKWLRRANVFMHEAERATTQHDRVRLTAMASTMHYAADDLCSEAGIDPNTVPLPRNPDVEQQRRIADERHAVLPLSPGI